MAWLRIDDNVSHHTKMLKAGPAACWLWVCGLAYCQRHKTDGSIPTEALAWLGVKKPDALATALVNAGLWKTEANGWRVHDFLQWNDSAEVRNDKTKEKSERQRRWRECKSDVDASTSRSVDASTLAPVDTAPPPPPTPTPTPGGRAPRRGYADPFGFRRDFDAAAVVVVDESRTFSIPSKWADRVRGRYGLTEADIEAFAKALADHVKAAGEVDDGGNFLGWLDARLGAWRAGRDDEQQAAAMRQSARDFLDEQVRVDATIPHRTPEQVRAILRPPKGGAE